MAPKLAGSPLPQLPQLATVAVLALLVAATLAAYWPVLRHDFFAEWDDPDYVTANPHVQAGLTAQSIAWAFGATDIANWFPLTRLSHILDCQLFGLNPMGHHLTSLILHVANTLLLFAVLRCMTGAVWPSCAVAALFALHPLHVESVAWVAERKDVLSTAFWLLALLAYYAYTRHGGWLRYSGVIAAMALGLMAKPMLVTLPLVLLLMDYWPLRRVNDADATNLRVWGRLLVEKLPLLALSAVSGVITFLVQNKAGAVASVRTVPFAARLANVPVSCVRYLGKTFFPVGLSPLYPFNLHLPVWLVAGAVVVLVLATVGAVWAGRRRRYLATGWFWYVVTLLPVIGLVQVGGQAMADRYTYVPLIGIFIIIVWGLADLGQSIPAPAGRGGGLYWAGIAAVAGVFLFLALSTRQYLGCWQNSFTLFTRALEVNEANDTAHFNLGLWLANKDGKLREAADHFQRAVALNPRHVPARYSLGLCQERLGDPVLAAQTYRETLAMDPLYGMAHHNLAVLLERDGKTPEAIEHYEAALKANPQSLTVLQDLANAHNNLGSARGQHEDLKGAEAQFLAAARLVPTNLLAQANLAVTFYREGRYAEAWQAVAACRQLGGSLPPSLLTNLAREMPEPKP